MKSFISIESIRQKASTWPDRVLGSLWRGPLLLLCVLPLAGLVAVNLSPSANVALSLLIVGTAGIVAYAAPKMRLAVLLLSAAVSTRYILWRATQTLDLFTPADAVASVLLLGAEIYAFVTLILGYFQNSITHRNRPIPLDVPETALPTVDVCIATYNEGVDLLRATIAGAMNIDYPHKTVWVLDDGRRPEVEALAALFGARYLTRPDNTHAKAGNLNHALRFCTGDLVAFFDADHVPTRGFLNATVGFFLKNPKLALVQTPHHFYNADPFLRNLRLEGVIPPEQHLFYHGVQLGNDFWNSAFFCGSCAVMRRSALDEVGGIATDTVTEDAHTALQLHAHGWDSLYYDVPLAAGLAAESFALHIGQRIRWARGMAQIFRIDNPLFKRGLNLAQRLNYFNACWHFLFGVPRLIFLIVPALYLIFDVHPLDANVRDVLLYAVPHLMLVQFCARLMNRNLRSSVWPEVFELAIAPYTAVVTTVALIMPSHGRFNVTGKGETVNRTWYDWRHALPLVLLQGLMLAALIATPLKIQAQPVDRYTILVVAAWNVYNMILLSAALVVAWERPQRRKYHRIERHTPVHADVGDKTSEGVLSDLSMGGVCFTLPTQRAVPGTLWIEVRSPTPVGRTAHLHVRVVDAQVNEGTTVVKGEFIEPTGEALRVIAEVLFSDTDAWSHDAYAFDRPLHAFLQVLAAPVIAIFGTPAWLQAILKPIGATSALVPGMDDRHCWKCSAQLVTGASHCERCGAALRVGALERLRPARMASAPRLTTARFVMVPSLMLIGALTLAANWQPVDTFIAPYLPAERYANAMPETRLANLVQAWHELSALERTLKEAIFKGQDVGMDWSSQLWSVQRTHEIDGDTTRNPQYADAEALLHEVLFDLANVEKQQHERRDRAILDPQILAIEQRLLEARKALQITE